MFRLNRNERSHWSGNGVHVESELVFMIGRNMHSSVKQFLLYTQINCILYRRGNPGTSSSHTKCIHESPGDFAGMHWSFYINDSSNHLHQSLGLLLMQLSQCDHWSQKSLNVWQA